MMVDKPIKTVLLVGALGSIGQRYKAILEWLGCDVTPYDIGYDANVLAKLYDGIIIASPTTTHFNYINLFKNNMTPILVEKPMCATVAEAAEISKDQSVALYVHVVDNWAYILNDLSGYGKHTLVYKNYYTGKEKLAFNLAQPAYFTRGGMLKLELNEPMFTLHDIDKPATYNTADVDYSYIKMLSVWVKTGETSMNVLQGLVMQQSLEELERREKL